MDDSGPISRFSPGLSPYTAAFAEGGSAAINKTPSPFDVSTSKPLTLADIRRQNLDEQQALKDEAHLRRFRMFNYSSDNSVIQQSERKLKTFYCAICATHALVTEADLPELPRRNSDQASCLKTSEFFNKIYAVPAERIILRRFAGLEMQYR